MIRPLPLCAPLAGAGIGFFFDISGYGATCLYEDILLLRRQFLTAVYALSALRPPALVPRI